MKTETGRGRVLVLRPEANRGRCVAFGYQVDEKLGEYGGFYVETLRKAIEICDKLKQIGIPDWVYVEEGTIAEEEASGEENPVAAAVVRQKGYSNLHVLSQLRKAARKIMENGGPEINLHRSKRKQLEMYIREYEREKEVTADGAGPTDSTGLSG